jgi:AraC-like DNA-binding protein
MKLNIKYDINITCKKIIQDQLEKLGLNHHKIGLAEVEIKEMISLKQQDELNAALSRYGIEIVTTKKSMLIQKIKDIIIEMVHLKEELPPSKTSAYLSEKLNHSYGYLSNLFTEVTHTSIGNFIILQKIERAKQLIIANELNLTEISYQLNYSSVAHLCNQFKKTTGLTPSVFQKVIKRRCENSSINC